jgi:hypothetical protein
MYDGLPQAEDVEIFAAQLEHLGWATLTPFLSDEPDQEVHGDEVLAPPADDSSNVQLKRAS